MRNIDQAATSRKLQSCLHYLKTENCKVGVLGWSFGGLQAQHALLENPELVDALSIFYCRILFNRQNIHPVHAPILAIFAETERTWPDKQADLEQLMAEYDKTLVCESFDASHGFANPDGNNYDNDACEGGWAACASFFKKYL